MRGAGRRAGAMFVSLLAVFATVTVLADPPPAAALTGSQFNPGNIISDATFYNSSTMTAAGIQSFLSSKASSNCAGASPACVRDYHANITAQSAETGLCSALTAQSNVSAAGIFYTVAKACGVNPQVLLVTSQKESSLITTSSPNYTTTMGYGCPDSTGCSSKYYGFFNQVYLAARQFKLYRKNPDNYGYVAGTTTFILYNPKTSCSGTNVFIQNQATAGLYDYTPYQPNAAALVNLHGSGDSCSAYGNRNFWVFFNEWFGSTVGLPTAPHPYDRGGIVGTKTGGAVWYYANNGSATHPLSTGVQVLGSPTLSSVVATGDLSGDGLADIVTVTSAGALWTFTNNGTTQPYGAPTQIGFSGWQQFNRILLADIAGNGRAELVVTRPDGTAGFYPYSGNPSRPVGVFTSLGSGWQAFTRITSGDVNSDGFADLIAKKADGTLWWLRNTGKATAPFGSWARLGSASFSAYDSIVGDDTNADGHADLIARKPDGSLWFFANSGSLTNPFGTPLQIGWSGWSQFSNILSISVAVPHRDEQSNLVMRNPSGTGSLDMAQSIDRTDPFTTSTTIGASGWAAYPHVVAGDFTGSGRADLIAVDKAGLVWLYRNTGISTHRYASRVQLATGWTGLKTVLAGDVNADGKDDIVAVTGSGALQLYANNGSTTTPFGKPVQIGFSGWNAFTSLALTDVTGDHRADLLAVTATGQLRDYAGNGSTTRPFGAYTTIGSSGWQNFAHLVPVTRTTVTGTAPADLLAITSSGAGTFYRNVGIPNRPYVGAIALPGTPWSGQASVIGGLVTGSGQSDTVGITSAGAMLLDTNQGSDVFTSPFVIGASGWDTFTTFSVGDVNGDRLADIVAVKPVGSMYYYPADTTATHPYSTPIVIGASGWQNFDRVMLADVTGDGLADIVATKPDGTLWLFQADTDSNATHPYGDIAARQIGTGWQNYTRLALGDINGDGLADIVGVQADGSLWAGLNRHTPTSPFAPVVRIGSGFGGYDRLALGHVEHDGLADVFATKADGSAWYCRNIPGASASTPFPGCVPVTTANWTNYDLLGI